MKVISKLKNKYVIIALAIVFSAVLFQLVPAVMAATTTSDPVIYDSTYIDKKEAELKDLIKSTNAELEKKISANADLETKLSIAEKKIEELKEGMTFKIIKLPAGKILIGKESTEIIVRNKNRVTAYVEKTATGGVSNLISGYDIKNGETIPDNQLLLIPKGDGRGLKAKSDADIMIKGSYTIK